ncbi:hypothetical protein TNIN_58271, partial [Trichonephila inaurata madagascariensis]
SRISIPNRSSSELSAKQIPQQALLVADRDLGSSSELSAKQIPQQAQLVADTDLGFCLPNLHKNHNITGRMKKHSNSKVRFQIFLPSPSPNPPKADVKLSEIFMELLNLGTLIFGYITLA